MLFSFSSPLISSIVPYPHTETVSFQNRKMSSSNSSSFSSQEVILTSSPDGPIMAYDASTGATVARFTDSRSPCRGLTVVGQGLIAVSHVFSDTGAGSVHIYKWYTSAVFNNFPLPEPVAPLTATSDGAFLFAGGIFGNIHSLSLPSGDLIKSFSAHSKPISSLHLSGDGSLMISGSDDGTIVVIPTFRLVEDSSYSSAEEDSKDFILHQWKAHSDSVIALSSGIGNRSSATLVSCSLDCTCKFWSLSDGVLMRTVSFPCAIFGVAFDPEEYGFYAAGADGLVYKGLLKVGSRKMVSKGYELVTWSERHNGSVVSLVLVNKGRNLVSAAEDGSVWMWDVVKGEVVMVIGNNMGSVSDMIVARGNREYGVRKGNVVGIGGVGASFTAASSSSSSRLCDEEMVKTLMQITELGDVLDVVIQDKKRAINMLESAIAMYERLLKLILKEAKKALGSSTGDEESEKEREKDQEEE